MDVPPGYESIAPTQMWASAENPEPQLNFVLVGTPRRAGDVNGDGISDYLYSATARDERTDDVLEDRVGKTALYFGVEGPLPEEPDQFLYREITPVGDLNGDGFDDALETMEDAGTVTVRLVAGSSSGYNATGVTAAADVGRDYRVVGFSDVDGQGGEDVLLYDSFFGEKLALVSLDGGASGDLHVRTFPIERPDADQIFRAADLDGDGQAEIVRLWEDRTAPFLGRISIYDVESDNSLNELQTFSPDIFSMSFRIANYDVFLANVSGTAAKEIILTAEEALPRVFSPGDGAGSLFDESPTTLDKDDAAPVGDLDGDGRYDFYTFDESTGTRYISYGPADLADGLSFDVPLSYPAGVSGTVNTGPYGKLGDLNGDGIDDTVLSYANSTAQAQPVAGRNFVFGSEDRSVNTVSVTYPRERFYDRVYYTSNVGDINGDGIDDLALPRFDRGETNIFFGGQSLLQTPDLTLPTPFENYPDPIIGADVNGDGYSDVVAMRGAQVDVFFGGPSMDASIDARIDGADFLVDLDGVDFEAGDAIGDVNGDGADDLLLTEGYGDDQDNRNSAYLFFGGESLSPVPDATLEYGSNDRFVSDDVAHGTGDINGDGIDDFVLADPDRETSAPSPGALLVYFGEEGEANFSNPDLTIASPREAYRRYPLGVAAGDFDGDGHRDVAAKPAEVGREDAFVHIYRGGPALDTQADYQIEVPAGPLAGANGRVDFGDEDGLANTLYGQLLGVPTASGPDALVVTTPSEFYFAGTNALVYQGMGEELPTVLQAPNSAVGLGSFPFTNSGHNAVGDFDGDGQVDLVLPQTDDNNEAARSSRVYHYPLGIQTGSRREPPAQLTYDVTRTFGDAADPSDYRLVALPGSEEMALTEAVPGAFGTGWKAFGQSGDGEAVVEAPEATFGPGRGFWVVSTGTLAASGTVPNVTLTGAGTYTVALHDGWNIVSNPTGQPLDWQTIRTANGRPSQPLWAFEAGSYTQVETMASAQTGTAYYFNNAEGLSELALPYYAGTPAGASTAAPPRASADAAPAAWTLGLTASQDAPASNGREAAPAFHAAVQVGAARKSAAGFDARDRFAPPGRFEAVSFRLQPDAFAQENAELAADYRAASAGKDGHRFALSLRAAPGRPVTLRTDWAAPKAEGRRAVLLRPSTGERFDLTEGNAFQLTPASREESLTLLVGSASFVKSERPAAPPEESRLLGGYPNPFRNQATIAYTIAEPSEVRLEVYDALGRKVRTLVDEVQTTGRQDASFDASALASGVYLIRLYVGDHLETGRLVHVH